MSPLISRIISSTHFLHFSLRLLCLQVLQGSSHCRVSERLFPPLSGATDQGVLVFLNPRVRESNDYSGTHPGEEKSLWDTEMQSWWAGKVWYRMWTMATFPSDYALMLPWAIDERGEGGSDERKGDPADTGVCHNFPPCTFFFGNVFASFSIFTPKVGRKQQLFFKQKGRRVTLKMGLAATRRAARDLKRDTKWVNV